MARRAGPDRLCRRARLHGGARRRDPRRARPASWSGWSSTRRSTRPAPAPAPTIWSSPTGFPVFEAGRGGEYTYHGPGQRVAYVMLDLKRAARGRARLRRRARRLDHRARSPRFNVRGERREDRVGVWVVRPDRPPLPDGSPAEDKIAAIGIRLRRWVSFHGIAINVEPDLVAFLRHRALRRRRSRRHQPGRSRPAGDDGRSRPGAEGGLRARSSARCSESRAELTAGRQADGMHQHAR